jgi:pyruvate kinase
VARGDLGVELPVQALPPIQKRLVHACRSVGKPVIVATQMMESMITSPVPTRAEVSDVANAIYEGADAVMLSAESAAGEYPVEAVTTMDNVAVSVESDPIYRDIIEAARTPSRHRVADAIMVAAREVAETTDISAICCFTHSGTTALLAARERPRVPIIALTPLARTAGRLTLSWGLHCVITEDVNRFKMAVVSAVRAASNLGISCSDNHIVVVAGIPFGQPGSTNILRVAPCDERKIFAAGAED